MREVDVPFSGPGGTVTRPAIEFAFNYLKYNADRGANFTPANITYAELDSTRGTKDTQNYLWNDEYTLSQSGSPNPGEAGGNGTQNVYQLDTIRMSGFPPPPPDLVLVKTPDAQTVNAGDPIEFTLTVTNQGPGVARNVTITDELPPGPTWTVTQQPETGICAISGRALSCTGIGDLAAGQSRTVKVGAQTSFDQCAVYDNTATASAANNPPVSNGGSITCQKPKLVVEKTPDGGTVNAGDQVKFTIKVTNQGPGGAKNVTITDTLPSAAGAWKEAPDTAECAIAGDGRTLSCTISGLGVDESFTVTVSAPTSLTQCGRLDNPDATATVGNQVVTTAATSMSSLARSRIWRSLRPQTTGR